MSSQGAILENLKLANTYLDQGETEKAVKVLKDVNVMLKNLSCECDWCGKEGRDIVALHPDCKEAMISQFWD